MTEKKERPIRFFGTYFDIDHVLRMSRWASVTAWIILAVTALTWFLSLWQFGAQFSMGMFYYKGMTILDYANLILPMLGQPIPGIFTFFGMQAIAHFLLVLLDIEDNTRRSARG